MPTRICPINYLRDKPRCQKCGVLTQPVFYSIIVLVINYGERFIDLSDLALRRVQLEVTIYQAGCFGTIFLILY